MTAWTPNGAIYDDFRAVTPATNLSGRTSVSGHTWVVYGQGSVTWEIQSPGHGAVGNVASTSDASAWNDNRIGIDFGSADVDVECVLEDDGEGVLSGGLMMRRTAAGFYKIVHSSGEVAVERRTDDDIFGTTTNLHTFSSVGGGELSVLRCVAAGNDLTVYLDGALLGTVTDSTYAGTVHGLYQRFTGSNASHRFYAFNMRPVTGKAWVGTVH